MNMLTNLYTPSMGKNKKWTEQVHAARWDYYIQCVGSRIDLRVVEDLFDGIGEIAVLRVTMACLPVLHTLGNIERRYASLRRE